MPAPIVIAPHRRAMPLTVLAGLEVDRVADLGAGLLLRGDRLALIRVDPWTAHLGHLECRVTDSDGRCTTQTFDLEHDCLSCTLRITTATVVRRLAATGRYDALLIHLPAGIEPSAAVPALDAELAGDARVDTVVVDLAPGWLELLGGDADVTEVGAAIGPSDRRPAAAVLASQLDAASVVVLGGPARRPDALASHAALGALCPEALRAYPPSLLDLDVTAAVRTGSHEPARLRLLTRGGLLSPRSRYLSSRPSLSLVRWEAAGPLHPGRLHDALDRLAAGVVRSSGRLWFANRPELAIGWDSAGDHLALGPECRWPLPLNLAMRRPSPGGPYGGRHNVLAFLGQDLDEVTIRTVLDDCVLTPVELAAGPVAWRGLIDPFPEWGTDAEQGAA